MTDTVTSPIRGVVAIITVDGRVAATGVDFSTCAPGFSNLQKAQKNGAMRMAGKDLIKRYGGPVIERLFGEQAQDIAYDIYCGCIAGMEYREELIGWD